MKLVVRSKYWGRLLEGRLCKPQGNPDCTYRVIASQAIPHQVGEYWGCCPHRGKRVLELNENHFMDHFSGHWDLYRISSDRNGDSIFNEFFLLPQNQACIDVAKYVERDGWVFLGTIGASMARMDLEMLLLPYMKENQRLGRHYHHVHIQILMDQAIDREIPKGTKNGEKKKKKTLHDTDKNCNSSSNNNNNGVVESAEEMEPTVDTILPPPIPFLVANDSWASETSNSTAMTWNDEYWPGPHVPQMYPPPMQHCMPIDAMPCVLAIPPPGHEALMAVPTWTYHPWPDMRNQYMMVNPNVPAYPYITYPGTPMQYMQPNQTWPGAEVASGVAEHDH